MTGRATTIGAGAGIGAAGGGTQVSDTGFTPVFLALPEGIGLSESSFTGFEYARTREQQGTDLLEFYLDLYARTGQRPTPATDGWGEA